MKGLVTKALRWAIVAVVAVAAVWLIPVPTKWRPDGQTAYNAAANELSLSIAAKTCNWLGMKPFDEYRVENEIVYVSRVRDGRLEANALTFKHDNIAAVALQVLVVFAAYLFALVPTAGVRTVARKVAGLVAGYAAFAIAFAVRASVFAWLALDCGLKVEDTPDNIVRFALLALMVAVAHLIAVDDKTGGAA